MASPEFVKGIYTGQCRRVAQIILMYVEEDFDCKLALFIYIEARRYRISKARLQVCYICKSYVSHQVHDCVIMVGILYVYSVGRNLGVAFFGLVFYRVVCS